nr:hypothetical protein [uncultured Draconibacterium sp.]
MKLTEVYLLSFVLDAMDQEEVIIVMEKDRQNHAMFVKELVLNLYLEG